MKIGNMHLGVVGGVTGALLAYLLSDVKNVKNKLWLDDKEKKGLFSFVILWKRVSGTFSGQEMEVALYIFYRKRFEKSAEKKSLRWI
ncbi:MAG: hypothetical protein IPG79_19060 [Saprospiraceae bacterium]|nr:hypothetical protein [Saprospiraceae bacterium]